jgi:glycosyltransferase involved in cell wall biosynthesis
MRIALIDPTRWQFTVDTPYMQPLGGSHSAVCYLAVELARLGHVVTIYNGIMNPIEQDGVETRNCSEVQAGTLNKFEYVIIVNAAIGRTLRRDYRVNVPMVLWTHHAVDQAAILELNRLNERKSWSGFAFVSNWQRESYEKEFWVQGDKSRVLLNGISPAFAAVAPRAPWFDTDQPPVLFYSSTPFRGLDVLLDAFPAIRVAVPETRLRVYSSMAVYQVKAEDDAHRPLYDRAGSMEGVEYIGSVGQSRLANELADTAALAFPSTFAETFCITALEAMASGAAVLTTRLGALPETTNGFAAMVDWEGDKTALAKSFAAMTIEALREMRQNPAAAAARRDERLRFARDNYQWSARAQEWVDWLSQIGRRA